MMVEASYNPQRMVSWMEENGVDCMDGKGDN